MPAVQTVLVLQGGGALGAYQGGAFERLVQQGLQVDWVVGTSIGAINGALIAGNPPERRVQRLSAFWERVAQDAAHVFTLADTPAWLRPWSEATKTWNTLTQGVPGFFKPRAGAIWNIQGKVGAQHTSFYDTSPLLATLEELVDFDYLHEGKVRLTVSAVNVATGELEIFDNRGKKPLGARHIMASGALPPGFAPVEIDGQLYWDGGIYSNTPIDIVLDDIDRTDTLCFMIDLWDPTEEVPASIAAAMTRQKDIQYASRSAEHLDDHTRMQNLRRAIQLLAERLPASEKKNAQVKALAALGCAAKIDIVRLIMKALPGDDQSKDIDFSRATVQARWSAGTRDMGRALAHKSWLKMPPANVGMVVHELAQE